MVVYPFFSLLLLRFVVSTCSGDSKGGWADHGAPDF